MGIGANQNQRSGMNMFGLNSRVPAPPAPPPPLFGANNMSTPRFDFNSLPRTQVPQAQPYQRPQPQQPINQQFTPQFDVQALMQSIEARRGTTPQFNMPMQQGNALQQGISSSLTGLAGLQQYSGGIFGES
jgi:hypothetical protein